MFKKFFVGSKNTKEYPYYVDIDYDAWDKYRGENPDTTLNDFIAKYGVKRFLAHGQVIPEGYIGVEQGVCIKLRF